MTTLELRTEIHKAIENLPEKALPEILSYLDSVLQPTPANADLKKFIDKIFKEDAELLKKLAE
jgi:hypothetical protein